MTTFDDSVAIQTDTMNRMTNHYQRFLELPPEDKSVVLARSRRDRLDQDWRSFTQEDREMRRYEDYDPSHEYYTNSIYYDAQSIYDLARSKYTSYIEANTAPAPALQSQFNENNSN